MGGETRVEPRGGPTRCPYCHEVCEATDDACACVSCLARHHRACWAEAGGCASCRATARLETSRVADDRGYGEAIDAWLKLGIVYNAVLVAITGLALNVHLLRLPLLVEVVAGAVGANVCFLLGPALELFARRLGYRGKLLRWCLFVPGLLVAMVLALAVCLATVTGFPLF